MQIAPGINAKRWRQLRLNSPTSPDWCQAVDIGRSRIRGRFLDAIDLLVRADEAKQPHQRRLGFAIMALNCLLVEALQAFREGLLNTRRKSEKLFVRFLTTHHPFSGYFDNATASDFYRHFRCGILHQAASRHGARVWSVGPLLGSDSEGLVVNRTKFTAALEAYFEAYLNALRDPAETELRRSFRKVMDHIAAAL